MDPVPRLNAALEGRSPRPRLSDLAGWIAARVRWREGGDELHRLAPIIQGRYQRRRPPRGKADSTFATWASWQYARFGALRTARAPRSRLTAARSCSLTRRITRCGGSRQTVERREPSLSPRASTERVGETTTRSCSTEGVTSGAFRPRGGTPALLAKPDSQRGHLAYLWPHVLPGGKAALITLWMGTDDTSELGVVSLADGEVTELGIPGASPRYASSGHVVFARADGSILAAPFSLRRSASPVPRCPWWKALR